MDEAQVALVVVGERELVVAAALGQEALVQLCPPALPAVAGVGVAAALPLRLEGRGVAASAPGCPRGRCRSGPGSRRRGARASRSSGRTTGSPSSRSRSGRSACCGARAWGTAAPLRPRRAARLRATTPRRRRRPPRRRSARGTRAGSGRSRCPADGSGPSSLASEQAHLAAQHGLVAGLRRSPSPSASPSAPRGRRAPSAALLVGFSLSATRSLTATLGAARAITLRLCRLRARPCPPPEMLSVATTPTGSLLSRPDREALGEQLSDLLALPRQQLQRPADFS